MCQLQTHKLLLISRNFFDRRACSKLPLNKNCLMGEERIGLGRGSMGCKRRGVKSSRIYTIHIRAICTVIGLKYKFSRQLKLKLLYIRFNFNALFFYPNIKG